MSATDTDLGTNAEEPRRRYAEHRDYQGAEAATIERDIDATRADVRATLAALEHRLSFERLVELTIGRIRERGGEFAGNLTDTATQNPMPVLLTSIGLGWLMLMTRRGSHAGGNGTTRSRSRMAAASDTLSSTASRVGDRIHEAGDRLHEAGARLHGAFESSRDTLGEKAEAVRATASRAAAGTREQVDYARERMDRLLHEQPLLLGALGIAAGAIIGALLPATEAEGRLIGEVRDQAIERVARTSRTAYEAAKETGRAAAASYSGHAQQDGRDDERPSRPH